MISVLYEEYQDNSDYMKNSDIIVVCLNFDRFYPDFSSDFSSGKVNYEDVEKDCILKCEMLHSFIKNHSNAHIVWFGFEDYYCMQSKYCGAIIPFNDLVNRLNLFINDFLKEDTFVDFKRLIAMVGIENAFDIKGNYRWNAPYSKELIHLMVDEVYKQNLIAVGITKKCLVVDCDDVLWGGVLSEDGIEGIQVSENGLGRSFYDFQRYLLDLYYHGVILAICSKNDELDVLRVFRKHTGMLLKEEHIACFRCNWDNKPNNIKVIADNLNIGLESIVFVDDSLFEIEWVKRVLPEVSTVLYQRDSAYKVLSYFNLNWHVNLLTVKDRTSTYKTNIMRYELRKNAVSFDDYIASLKMVIDIHTTTESELSRVSELTQRTNKCTNGVRYTLEQLREMKSSENYNLYTVYLSDRFSNLGIVGTIGIKGANIDLFSLSCRALGRAVEDKMIEFILKKYRVEKIEFRSTGKNKYLQILLEKTFSSTFLPSRKNS